MAQSTVKIKRIAISTGGGDAPGLNAVIRAAVLSAINRGWEVYGIRDGYNGLLMPEQYVEGGLIRLTRERVRGITHLGGRSSAPPTAVTRSNTRSRDRMIPWSKSTAPMS